MVAVARVFISYRHVQPDEDLALNLQAFLERNGVDVFLDRDVSPGVSWPEELASRLAEADYFVILLSGQSILSEMVIEEARRAHRQRLAGRTKILPLRIGDLPELPYDLAAWLSRLQHERWQPADGHDGICARMLAAITGGESLPIPGTDSPRSLEKGALGSAVDSGAPLPSADPRPVMEAGTVPLASHFYVRRCEDDRVEEQIALPIGRTVVVRGPRQSGKSSLLARGRAFAARKGHRTFYIDFQSIDDECLADLPALMRYLGVAMQRELALGRKLADAWDPDLGARENLRRFLQNAVLAGCRVTMLFDEVDRVFARPWRTAFFAELRHWHNCRAMIGPPWDQFTLVLGHSTDPALWIDSDDQSPFNVADLSVWLEDFDEAEIQELNRRHGSPLSDVVELMRVFGGHPYLVRLALYTLRSENTSVSQLADRAMLAKSAFSHHLRRHLLALERNETLRAAVRRIIRNEPLQDQAAFDRLFSAGLVRGSCPSDALIRCELYARYLGTRL